MWYWIRHITICFNVRFHISAESLVSLQISLAIFVVISTISALLNIYFFIKIRLRYVRVFLIIFINFNKFQTILHKLYDSTCKRRYVNKFTETANMWVFLSLLYFENKCYLTFNILFKKPFITLCTNIEEYMSNSFITTYIKTNRLFVFCFLTWVLRI